MIKRYVQTRNRDHELVLTEDKGQNFLEWPRYVLASDYDALAAEVTKLRADAERYRWLTGDDHDTAGRDALFTITARLPFAGKGHVDAAIDAARGAT